MGQCPRPVRHWPPAVIVCSRTKLRRACLRDYRRPAPSDKKPNKSYRVMTPTGLPSSTTINASQSRNALPAESYTPWITRVLAAFIDWAPYVVLVGIGWVIMLVTQTSSCVTSISEYDVGQFCVSQPSMIGQLVQWLLSVGGLAYLVWNYGYRQGTIGSSIGKSVLKFKVVSETTGQPIGFGMSVVRQLAHFIDAIICFVGFLFPLWDAKRQTLADKIMTTVCVPI